MKQIFKRKKKKTYLKNIRQRKKNISTYIISILIFISIFISPVFYDSTKSDASFKETLDTYVTNINKELNVILKEIATNFLPPSNSTEGLTVHFIDIGQGDAALIQVNGKNLLVDAGDDDRQEDLIAYLNKSGIKKLDAFLVSHPHGDHMGGAAAVLDNFEVDNIYMTDYIHTTEGYRKLLLKIKEKGLKITQAKKGVLIDLGSNVKAEILAPGREYEDINSSSAVLKLNYKDTSFLFSGDATKETEKDILEDAKEEGRLDELDIDVYKVAHHGSDSSNSAEFLNAIKPELSIISVGKGNQYGHPHGPVLERLKALNTIILTTMDEGTIKVHSDGEQISYEIEDGSVVKLYK
jgi:beta-lactamase superfamily II metal-dependent hydrolase